MMTLRTWGMVAGAVLVQMCAGAALHAAQASALQPPSRPVWCPVKTVGGAASPDHLTAMARKIGRGEPVTVVAIGSSSTEGSDLPDRALAYPTHLQRQLAARTGTTLVKVLNKGRGGETMTETVERFAADVVDEKPDLVIWQLGVNDVVRGNDLAVSERNITNGMDKLKSLGAPVVLMDMQLAPRVTASPSLPVMKSLLKAAALKYGAMLWSRYELMDGIVKSGDAQLTDLVKPDDLHMTVAMHVCTAAVLGDVIAAGLTTAQTTGLVAAKTP